MGPPNPKRVLLIAENSLLREGLRHVLEGRVELEMIGIARDLTQARALAQTKTPDVVIVETENAHTEPAEVWSLMGGAESRVIAVALGDRSLRVYSRRSIPGASVEDLLDALCRTI